LQNETLIEFKQNYKNYLESKFLLSLIFDLVNENKNNNKGSTLDDIVHENFWKSYLISNKEKMNKLDEEFLEELRPNMLNNEVKRHLIYQIDCKLNDYLAIVNEYMNMDKKECNQFKLANEMINEDIDDDSPIDSHKTVNDLKSLIDSIRDLKINEEKLNEEISIKLHHCFNISIEIMNLLKNLIGEVRLKFYINENRTQYENEILKCDLLLMKIKTVHNEILTDLYSPERVKALRIIQSQIQLDMAKNSEYYANVVKQLNAFKSFGKEFDEILSVYLELNKDLERKRWTLNKLKENM
jgi:hypothetical protein